MKILHLITSLNKGGAQRIAIDICRELSKREGVKVLLVYFEGKNQFEYLTDNLHVKKIKVDFDFSVYGRKKFQMEELSMICKEFSPDIIHSHLFLTEFISRNYIDQRIKYFTHCHDNMRQFRKFSFQTILLKSRFVEFWERRYLFKKYRAIDNHFLAISEDNAAFLKSNLPDSFQKKIHLLHNAIDLKEFNLLTTINDDSEQPLRLINVGNFIKNKNQFFLVRVVRELLSMGINVQLTFVGEGETMQECKDLSQRLQVNDRITFLGRMDNVSELLSKHDLYVHSATYESFGLVLVEAMATGLPVVSLDGKGNRDIIVNGKNGYLIAQNDLSSFVEKIRILDKNRSELKKMSEYALDFSARFKIETYVDNLLSLYK